MKTVGVIPLDDRMVNYECNRLHVLRDLKTRYPSLTLLAYNVLMRISRSNNSEEEKPYWHD